MLGRGTLRTVRSCRALEGGTDPTRPAAQHLASELDNWLAAVPPASIEGTRAIIAPCVQCANYPALLISSVGQSRGLLLLGRYRRVRLCRYRYRADVSPARERPGLIGQLEANGSSSWDRPTTITSLDALSHPSPRIPPLSEHSASIDKVRPLESE